MTESGADRIDVGITGFGAAGAQLAEEIRASEGATLVAMAEVDDDARRRAGERFDIPASRRYSEYETLLDAEPLDAVVIATPQGVHYDQLRLAFDHDLHVLCEKPLVTTVSDSRDIVARDEAREEVLMVGYQRHLYSAYARARDRWADGETAPRFVTAEITQDWTGYFEDGTNWRLDPALSGGGHLFNVGTHIIDAVLWTTGLTPESVTAEMTFHDAKSNDEHGQTSGEHEPTIDEQSTVNVRFENGSLAAIADTGLAHSHRERVHAWDERGTVRITATNWGRPRFEATNQGGGTAETDSEIVTVADSPSRVAAFVSAIRDGAEPPATARDAHRTTAVLEAAYESVRRGERVDVQL